LAGRWKSIPEIKKEEELSSREFWMFIGAIVLMLSSLHLTVATSLPVINKIMTWAGQLFSKSYEANYTIVDAVGSYNKFQLPIAALVAIFSTAGLFLKFKQTGWIFFLKKMILPVLLATAITTPLCILYHINQGAFIFLLWTGTYSVSANAMYFITTLRGKFKLSGAALSHLGLGMMIMGILISGAKQRVVSENTMGIDFGSAFDARNKRENILLYKNIPFKMGDYNLVYTGDSLAEPNHYYKVRYTKGTEQFMLYPNAQINPKMGLVATPDTKHYLFKDLYTHVTSVPDHSQQDKSEKHWRTYVLHPGDTFYTSKYLVHFIHVKPNNHPKQIPDIAEGDIAAEAVLELRTMNDSLVYTAKPLYFIKAMREISTFEDFNREMGLHFNLTRIDPKNNTVQIDYAESTPDPDYIIMKAIIFPQINLLWLGTVIMILGFAISLVRKMMRKQVVPQKEPDAR
jgi:cytochrome c-type biogenesis protein CcmF